MAWNWSFLLPDAAFSTTGIAALRAARRRDVVWLPLTLLSIAVTMTAGGMAVASAAIRAADKPIGTVMFGIADQ